MSGAYSPSALWVTLQGNQQFDMQRLAFKKKTHGNKKMQSRGISRQRVIYG